jgi:hypothetical protein
VLIRSQVPGHMPGRWDGVGPAGGEVSYPLGPILDLPDEALVGGRLATLDVPFRRP